MPIFGLVIKKGIQLSSKIKLTNRSASEQQIRTLRKLLETAANTSFGRHYEFQNILDNARPMHAFRESLPIFDYDKIYEKWWHKLLEGNENVTWPGKIKYFALSSGTSGAPSKYIPCTDESLGFMQKASTSMFLQMANLDIKPTFYEKQMLMLGSCALLKETNGYLVGDLSGINASRIPSWFQRYYKPGKIIASLPDYNSRIDAIAREAHKWDIGVISGIPAWVQLMLEKVVAFHKLENIHQLWPNFQIYVSGGVAFEPYRKSFERLTGKPITILDTYLASEGFVGYQDKLDVRGMKLVTGNGIYYEFVPFNDQNFDPEGNIKPDAKALTLEELEEEKDYALLMSASNGAWRYLIGDTVRFLDLDNLHFIITGRTKHFLSITGEHLSVDNMNTAIQYVASTLGVEIKEFTVMGIPKGKMFAHQWYIGTNKSVETELVSKLIDEKLQEINDDYRAERQGNALTEILVKIVPVEKFYQWQESQGKLGGQSKFPRVMKKDKWEEWERFNNL
jgi:GH3 auxin-responsive promoter